MERHTKRIALGLAAACLAPLAAVAVVEPAPGEAPTVRELYQTARQRYAPIDSYVARLTRREVVKGKQEPEELILLKFRERPWSAYMKWLGEEGRGREATYVKGRYGDKIHVLVAAGDVPFIPAGRKLALSPDGALVRSASPHPVTEVGVGASIETIGAVLAAQERGDRRRGTLRVVGPEKRPELDEPVYGVEHRLPAGIDPALPRGGRRTYYFDPVTKLPTLVVGHDDTGREVEHYRYDRLQYPVHLDDEDFDPDVLWPAPVTAARRYPGPDRP